MTLRLKKFILLPLLCALLLLTACGSGAAAPSISSSSGFEKKYRTAEALLDAGQYEQASAAFEALGSYGDASLLLMYSRAALAGENGDYAAAEKAFSALDGFRDAQNMRRYYEGREAEAAGQTALGGEDFETALRSLTAASEIYGSLADFRDASQRGGGCLTALYDRGCGLMTENRYEAARDLLAGLGAYQDAGRRVIYCEAALLEAGGSNLAAADRFSEVSDLLDAAARAETNREGIYQKALAAADAGETESSIVLFSSLGQYRDSESRRTDMARVLIQTRLQNSDYEGALFALDAAPEAVTMQPVDAAEKERFASFLDEFVQAYLHFSAGSMDAYSGYYGVYPYIEPDGALEWRFRQVLMIGSYSHNSNFNYYGSELLDLFRLEGDYYLAYLRASASVNQPVGPVEVTRTFRIVVHDTASGLVAGSIEDCLYGDAVSKSGRQVISGPLPNGELPPDEDGDGIIIVDIMKKGFQGTMIIVLDPSRVFVGGPGFYGGNGMLLEELANRYDALGGINGGGFIDEDGGGSGGLPEGLTIVDGESYYWAGSGASAAFDQNNILHVGFYTKEAAAEAGFRDCASFGPELIVDGVGEYGNYMESGINPRTAIGQRADGVVLMLCIDGRQLHSIGGNFADIRDVMLDFGAVNACSLDGGSSTVMYFNGEYLNSPSSASGTSRYLPNAFLIRK